METNAVDVSGILGGITDVLGDFSVGNLTTIFAGGVAIAVGLVIFWFAARYLVGKLMGAFRKGKI